MGQGKTLVFSMSPGRSGTGYLSALLSGNLGYSDIAHEDTVVSSGQWIVKFNHTFDHDTLDRAWESKLSGFLDNPAPVAGETSHLLMKAGLIENLHRLKGRGDVVLCALERDKWDVLRSYSRRTDFQKIGRILTYYLHPGFKNNIVPPDPFSDFREYGAQLWYLYEMQARTVYYRDWYMPAHVPWVRVISTTLERIATHDGAQSFLTVVTPDNQFDRLALPTKINTQQDLNRADVDEDRLTRLMTFDTDLSLDIPALVADYWNSGKRLKRTA